MRIAVVTGNPKSASRTHGVALAVAGTLSAALACPDAPASGAHLAVDLAGHAPGLFDPSDAELSRLTVEVAGPGLRSQAAGPLSSGCPTRHRCA